MLQGQRILKMDGRNYVGWGAGSAGSAGGAGSAGSAGRWERWERLGASGSAWESLGALLLPGAPQQFFDSLP